MALLTSISHENITVASQYVIISHDIITWYHHYIITISHDITTISLLFHYYITIISLYPQNSWNHRHSEGLRRFADSFACHGVGPWPRDVGPCSVGLCAAQRCGQSEHATRQEGLPISWELRSAPSIHHHSPLESIFFSCFLAVHVAGSIKVLCGSPWGTATTISHWDKAS